MLALSEEIYLTAHLVELATPWFFFLNKWLNPWSWQFLIPAFYWEHKHCLRHAPKQYHFCSYVPSQSYCVISVYKFTTASAILKNASEKVQLIVLRWFLVMQHCVIRYESWLHTETHITAFLTVIKRSWNFLNDTQTTSPSATFDSPLILIAWSQAEKHELLVIMAGYCVMLKEVGFYPAQRECNHLQDVRETIYGWV